MLLVKLYNYLNSISLKIDFVTPIQKNKINTMFQLINNDYLSNNIKNKINKMNTKVSFNLRSRGINFKVNIYKKNENIDTLLIHLIYLLSFMSYFSKSKQDIYINYYLTDNKKTIPNKTQKSKVFTTNEINTGSCYNNKINIWRKEEILKVTIHELIHAFKIEDIDENLKITDKYRKRFNLNISDINIREAYTEFWSLLLHTYFYTRLTNNTFSQFESNLNKEIKFSYYQYSKILTLTSDNINKYTNVFAYYILKYEMIKNLDNILSFLFDNNKHLIKISNIDGFHKLIYSFRKNKIKKINKNDKYFQTMKMTILNLN